MNATTVIVSITLGYTASIFAVVWYLGSRIEHRIDRLEDRLGTRLDRIEERWEKHLEHHP